MITLLPSLLLGKDLTDLFSSGTSVEDFKEPEQIGIKRRWQIIQIIPTSTEPSSIPRSPLPTTERLMPKQSIDLQEAGENLKVESGIEVESIDGDEFEQRAQTPETMQHSDGYQEVLYRKGIYLDSNATLKDLRNGFINSDQIDHKNRFFQFLNSDMPGDSIPIDNEEDVLLSKLESNLLSPKTIYIEPVNSSE